MWDRSIRSFFALLVEDWVMCCCWWWRFESSYRFVNEIDIKFDVTAKPHDIQWSKVILPSWTWRSHLGFQLLDQLKKIGVAVFMVRLSHHVRYCAFVYFQLLLHFCLVFNWNCVWMDGCGDWSIGIVCRSGYAVWFILRLFRNCFGYYFFLVRKVLVGSFQMEDSNYFDFNYFFSIGIVKVRRLKRPEIDRARQRSTLESAIQQLHSAAKYAGVLDQKTIPVVAPRRSPKTVKWYYY